MTTRHSSLVVFGATLYLCACGASQQRGPTHTEPVAPVAPIAPVTTVTAPVAGPEPVVTTVPNDHEPPGRGALSRTIEDAVTLLRTKDYRKLIEGLVHPDDVARFRSEEGGVDALLEEFSNSEKPEKLREMLESIRGATPQLDDSGNEASFETPHGKAIRFTRFEGRWYIRNN